MPLKVSDGMGAWIDDFKKSDAPQFKGKDKKERRDMAIAAYMKAKNESVSEGKTIKVDHTAIADNKNSGYVLVQGRKCIARGTKEEMLRMHEETPKSRVWMSTAKVGEVVEAIDMSKVGTKATIMHPVTRVSKKVDKKDVKKHVDAGWMHMGPKRNRVTKGPYKVKEVLDTPKAMRSYKDKAKYSKDRATNSAVANILRKTDHSADLKTRAKRVKGLGMADRNAVRKFRKANESVDLNEEMTFRVDIEGLPAMFMQAKGPGALKQELRKIVKQPSMINDVKRVTSAVVKRTFRLKAQGRDDDGDGEIDERTDQWYDNQPEWGTDLSTIRARKKTPGQ